MSASCSAPAASSTQARPSGRSARHSDSREETDLGYEFPEYLGLVDP
jgi:hypothetical protein